MIVTCSYNVIKASSKGSANFIKITFISRAIVKMTAAFPREKQVIDFISNFNTAFSILSAVEMIGHRESWRKLAFSSQTSTAFVRDKEKSSTVVSQKRQNPRRVYCKISVNRNPH